LQQDVNFSRGTLQGTAGGDGQSGEDYLKVGDAFRTIWRGKLLIALVAVLCVIPGVYYAYFGATSMYEADTVLKLNTQEQTVLDIDQVIGGLTSDTNQVNSEMQVLTSRGLMQRVVEKLNLVDDPEFNPRLREPTSLDIVRGAVRNLLLGEDENATSATEEMRARRARDNAVRILSQKVTVRAVPSSVVFRIAASTTDPEKSARITDTIAELYILSQLETKFEATKQATVWLSEQVAVLRGDLEAAEARLSAFNTGTNLVSVETLQALERQLKDLRDRVGSVAANAEAGSKQVAAMEQATTAAQKAEMAQDPTLTHLLARINAGDAAAEQSFNARFDALLKAKRVDQLRRENQLEALRNSREVQQDRIAAQNADLIQLQQLTREAEATRALYEYFLARMKETSAQQGIQQADSSIISRAVVSGVATSPKRSMIMLAAGLFGLLLGTALVLLREARNRTFRLATDLERMTGLPVLGQLPAVPGRSRLKMLQHIQANPSSAYAEALRNLRTSLMLANGEAAAPQVILCTSAVPGDGKTTLSLTLAQNFAALGKRVVLVEGDVRRRSLLKFFDDLPKTGLSAVLAGEADLEDATYHSDDLNIDIIVGDQHEVNAADAFASDGFSSFIERLRGTYDVVIIDTAPVLVVPDARIAARVADAVLFVVRWDSTSMDQVQEGLRLFRQAGIGGIGMALTQINFRRMHDYGYGGKYGAYGAYGATYYQK